MKYRGLRDQSDDLGDALEKHLSWNSQQTVLILRHHVQVLHVEVGDVFLASPL